MAFNPDEPRDEKGRWTDEGVTKQTGETVATGKPVKIHYLKNPEKAPFFGSRFGQDVEVAGFYFTQHEGYVPPGWTEGIVEFKNPLVIDITDQTQISYKNALSKKFGNKTGQALTNELMKRGYDGIITRDGKYLVEMIAFKNATIKPK